MAGRPARAPYFLLCKHLKTWKQICKEENKETLQGYLAYVNEQNIEAFLDTFSENVRYIRLEVFL